MASFPFDILDEDVSSLPGDPFAALVGTHVGARYRVDYVLGSGAMGCVFDALDTRLQRRVALKFAHPAYAPGIIEEARALAQVSHPGVVTVHDFGEHERMPYLVMERIYGISLEDHLQRQEANGGRFAIPEAVDVLVETAGALGAVHRAGIVHRDLKPANCMLAARNRVVLMDFGLTHAESNEAARTSVAGTPQYMSPEAIRGALAPGLSYLSDLYALGVLAWRVMGGTFPFDGEMEDVFRQHQERPVPSLADVRPEVPPVLSRLVTALLAKDPSDRPQAADDVVRELQQIRRRLAAAPVRETFSVLVVDDDPAAAQLFAYFVRGATPGSNVRIALGGQQALELVRAEPPDLMLVDLDMPGMNGLELCLFLRGTHLADNSKLVVTSAAASEEDVRVLYQLGLTHFVPKRALAREQIVAITQEAKRAFDVARARAA